MIRILSLGGTGDAYLVSALARAVMVKYTSPVRIALRSRYTYIPASFGMEYEVADDEVAAAENNTDLQRDYDNQVAPDRTFYAHPCFTRSGVRIDELSTLPGVLSQAHLYRALLGLSLDEPLSLPSVPAVETKPNSALLIPQAVSWPNDQPKFWRALERALRANGWDVRVNDPAVPLVDLFMQAAGAEMVAGPQCGVMSILVSGRFPCRKVFCTPSIDGTPGFFVGKRVLNQTYPYGYVTKFDGLQYNVEEYRLTSGNHAEVIQAILTAPRTPRDPAPVQ